METTPNPNTASFVNILNERAKQVALNADLTGASDTILTSNIQQCQTARARLYKAWDSSLRQYLRADEASQEQALTDYYHLTNEMIGAFSGVSKEINKIKAAFEQRKNTAAALAISEIQLLEKEKLQLNVVRHTTLRQGEGEGNDSTSERLSEIVEELRDAFGELR